MIRDSVTRITLDGKAEALRTPRLVFLPQTTVGQRLLFWLFGFARQATDPTVRMGPGMAGKYTVLLLSTYFLYEIERAANEVLKIQKSAKRWCRPVMAGKRAVDFVIL